MCWDRQNVHQELLDAAACAALMREVHTQHAAAAAAAAATVAAVQQCLQMAGSAHHTAAAVQLDAITQVGDASPEALGIGRVPGMNACISALRRGGGAPVAP